MEMDLASFPYGNLSELCPDLNWKLDIDWNNVDYSSLDENLTFGANASCPWKNKVVSSRDMDDDNLYEVKTGVLVALCLFYGTISLVAILGNALVMWIVATSRKMHSVTNYFIANLALADIIIGLFCIPFQFQAALLQRWNLPHFMCAFCPFFQTVSVNVSVFTLTAIAVDRYRAIVFPLNARPSKFRSKLVIVVIWLFSITIAIPNAIALRVVSSYGVERCLPINISQNHMMLYSYLLVGLQYFLPLGVISFAYLRMGWELWGSRQPGNADDTRDAHVLKNKKKVIKMLFIVVAIFTFCWAPLQTYHVLQEISAINHYKYINIVWFFCYSLAMSNSCCNPFIYAIYNEKFKREFRHKFRWLFAATATDIRESDRSRNGASYSRAKFHSVFNSSSTTSTNFSTSSCGSCKSSTLLRSSHGTSIRGLALQGAAGSARMSNSSSRGMIPPCALTHKGSHISSITGNSKLGSNSVDSEVASTVVSSKLRNSSLDSYSLDCGNGRHHPPTIRSHLLSNSTTGDSAGSNDSPMVRHRDLRGGGSRSPQSISDDNACGEKESGCRTSPRGSGCDISVNDDDVEVVHVIIPIKIPSPIDENVVKCEGNKIETSL